MKKLLKNLKNPLGKRVGVSERGLGSEKIEVLRERSRENEVRIALVLYIDAQ